MSHVYIESINAMEAEFLLNMEMDQLYLVSVYGNGPITMRLHRQSIHTVAITLTHSSWRMNIHNETVSDLNTLKTFN